jgi:hypothetical protein
MMHQPVEQRMHQPDGANYPIGGAKDAPAAKRRYGKARHGSAGKAKVERTRVPLGTALSLVTAS